MTSAADPTLPPDTVPKIEDVSGPLLLFDGVCNLCTGSVKFVIKHDRRERFRFASLQSPYARQLLGVPDGEEDPLSSMLLIVDGRLLSQSTAVLNVARRLDAPWPLASVFLLVPPFLRNWVYAWIGKRRYRWFGEKEACWLPDPKLAARFLG